MSGAVGDPEGLDLVRLRRYFVEHVGGARDVPLHGELIAGGRSNLTYVVSDGEHEWVLRRPPLGHVLETAHDMGREYRVQRGLRTTDVPVPRVDAFCDDPEVNGAPFYVMERVDGRVLRTRHEVTALSDDDARRCSRELVDVLVRLHAVDYDAVGLGEFGRPDGFVERNLRRWGKQWDQNKTRDLPAIDEIGRRLRAALPESGPPTIVHGDYRLDNTMLAPEDAGRVVAVLDWEMSTLGDPLTDLALLVVYWGLAQGSPSAEAIAAHSGFLSPAQLIERYAEQSGRAVDHLDFYVVFACYKLAVILEGIHARYLMGKTVGEGFSEIGGRVDAMAEAAMDLAQHSSIPALRG